ncbi:DNA repair exonuclease [bacterium]|nr:DNA repair exonuclease [bacterium]
MIKFLHAADLHLDSPLRMLERYEGAPVDELRLATRRALVNLVDLAITERVDFVVIAGDLYDGDWKDYNTGFFFIKEMTRLRDANIPVVMIAGNHDAASKMTKSLRLPDHVRFLRADKPETICFDNLGAAIHGQSFARPAVVEDLSQSYPDAIPGMFNLGLLHTCAEGKEGHAAYAPCKIDSLGRRGYDYWALGHIHKREILHSDPLIIFPGNTQGRHIRETGSKGCMLVAVDDRSQVSTEFRSLAVARWEVVQLGVTTDDREEDLFQRIQSALGSLCQEVDGMTTVFRIIVGGESSSLNGDIEHWLSEIRSQATQISGGSLWVESVKWRIRSPDASQSSDDGGPIHLLMQELDEIRSNSDEWNVLLQSANIIDFLRRLPPEFRVNDLTGEELGEDWLREALDDVGPLLLDRLLDRREDRR